MTEAQAEWGAMAAERRAAPRRRLTPPDRERLIVEGAAEFFAERGLGGQTRDLADRLGISQALLYRYFPTKDALIDRVLRAAFADRWQREWDRLIADRSRDLRTRLTEFYQAYARTYFNPVTTRLFVYAGLAGLGIAGRYGFPLTERILRPIAGELRQAAGLGDFSALPMGPAERELAMTLHAGIVFIGIRKYVYRMPLPENLDDLIALQVGVFLDGAVVQSRRVQAGGA